ncbi:MAG: Hpt domain-containing protein [Butyrivibrio sp.]|nr:Hpt domain-containing protein [Butyrivibrio sp.]
MNEDMKKELIAWGVNWDDVKDRFMGNEDLVERFMIKFLKDKSFSDLTYGMEKKDAKEAFAGCHSLKGVTGNLALDAMKEDVLELTEILRKGSLEGAEERYQRIKKSYDDLIVILNKYKG